MTSDKVVIDVRINEYALRGPNPHVPYSPEEIAARALECRREGAALIHYHARDPVTGAPSVDPAAYADTARRIKRESDLLIMPTLGAATLWHVGSIRATEALVEIGVFEEPVYCEIALLEGGLFAGHPGTVAGLEAFLSCMPGRTGWHWAVICFGGSLFPILRLALERGGHVAIGLGDHPYEELGCPTNAELVARVVRMAREVGREPATPAEARALLL